MKFKSAILSVLSITGLLTGCATTQPEIINNNFNSTLWVQTAAEYKANSIQTYHSAENTIKQALRDLSWTAALEQGSNYSSLPPAIILDVDETVLDNSQYEAQMVLDNAGYDSTFWDHWVEIKSAPAVPGAVSFLNNVADLGVEVIFITNRECAQRLDDGAVCPQEQDTIDNLLKVGIKEVKPEHILLKSEKPGWSSEKKSRREEVASHYRIVMLFGDDLGDFLPDVKKNITPEQRDDLVEKYRENWGRKWFVLSNPTYGSWLNILGDPKSNYLRGIDQ